MWKIMRVFYGFLWEMKVTFLFFIVVIIASGIVNAILPIFYKSFVDAASEQNTSLIYTLLLWYIIARIAGLILSMLGYTVGGWISIHSSSTARKKIFNHIQDLDFVFHTQKSTGYLISTIKRGDSAFFNFFHSIHMRIAEVVISFFVMLYTFSSIHWSVGLLALVSFLVCLVFTYFALKKNLSARKDINESEDEVSSIIVDNMIGFETVKLFAKEKVERMRLDKTFDKWKKLFWKYDLTFRYLELSSGSIIVLSSSVLAFLGLTQLIQRNWTVGEFVLVITFMNAFFPKLGDLVFALRDIVKNFADLQKYFEILYNQIQVKDPENIIPLPNIAGAVEFEDVSFTYNKTKKKSIKNFNLNVKPGESVALVGRSGAGKTTIVKLLMRFYDVDLGRIKVDDLDIRELTKEQLRSFIGVVPQEPILFNNTIAYNIAYGADRSSREEIKAAAKLANIDSFIESLADGYETNVGERGIKLSGGQKQRIAIARMILSNPKIVIFDEATSHLDSESEKLIQDAFWKASRNKTTFIIAHRLSTVMRADKIVVIERGKIAEIGTHKELLAKKESIYKYLWDLQINIS